ncbi:Trichodiene oxygenase [Talaromyces pinophilus]|nr:Trichodiene oxygenase [Talaromyces pinophilus]
MDTFTVASLGAVVLFYLATLASYRLFLHPLATFPGPKLAAITRYYEAYYDIVNNGQYTFKIAELHKEYGPIIRISPYELHVSDPAFFGVIYRQEGHWNKYDWSYDAFLAPGSAICSTDHNVHRRRRAPLNPFFSKATVAKRQNLINSQIIKLIDRIRDTDQSRLNIGAALSALTRDIATEYILARNYHDLDKEDFSEGMTDVLQSSGAMWRITKHVRWFGPMMKSLPLDFIEKIGDAGTKAFFGFLKDTMKITADIIAAKPSFDVSMDAPTIVHAILTSDLPPAEKEFGRIHDEVSTVSGAAFETSAQTLRVLLYYIYNDANILRRLRTEFQQLPPESRTKLSALEQLPYLTAVLMEGLRLSPGIATRTPRVAPDRDLVYDKWVIPKGTPVGMTTLLMHLDGNIYPNPKSFDPDRWTDLDTRKQYEKIYAPFSRGTRSCLGMHLAWAELYLTIAALVQEFDFSFEGTAPEEIEPVSDQFIIGTRARNGLVVRVKTHTLSE